MRSRRAPILWISCCIVLEPGYAYMYWSKQCRPSKNGLIQQCTSNNAPNRFSFGDKQPCIVLKVFYLLDVWYIWNFCTFSSNFTQIPNVESSDFRKKINFFAQNVVFLSEGVNVKNKCCFKAKEQVLTFSKHQKLLKSKNYSWWNLNFSDGVD